MSPRLTFRLRAVLAAGLAAVAAAPAVARTQGSLGVQGFGYPPGQLSTRALATGGAIAEVDFLSPVNPAALLGLGGTALYFQSEPEFRRVRVGEEESRTTTARFPVVSGGFVLGSRWAVGVSSSTLADRTWSTRLESLESIGDDTSTATSLYSSEGAINDLRVGVAYGASTWLRLGVGLHALSGRNRILVGRDFADARFEDFADTSTISYGGNALSAGMELRVARLAAFAASARKGGRVSATTTVGDSTIGRADVPDRFGVSAAYLGVANSVIAVRASQDRWSSLRGLGSSALRPRDTWDVGVGADVAGPRFGSRVVMLRAGGRWRDLPFAVVGPDGLPSASVGETSYSAGLGTLLAGGRGVLDLGVARVSRTADLDASERSWVLSFGLTVRP